MELDRIGNAGRTLDDKTVGLEGDEVAEDEQEQQLIETIGKITKDHAADHFLALHLVEQFTDQEAEECGDRHGHGNGYQEAADSGNLPFGYPEGRDLGSHGADGDCKVDAHAGYDRDDQSQNEEGIAGESAEEFVCNVGQGLAGAQDADDAHHNEQDRYGIITNDGTIIFTHETHLPTWSVHRG